jgi:carbonic anhydrase/acetyltransferase-like protein (isoleucine patch superfamily)
MKLSREEFNVPKKYEFTGETRLIQVPFFANGSTVEVKRIRSLKTFYANWTRPGLNIAVKAGELGGWIQSEDNLSHLGAAWVSDDAAVYGDASVINNAGISMKATVTGNATVGGNSRVCNEGHVCDNATILGFSLVGDNSWVYDNVYVTGEVQILGRAEVFGNARLGGTVFVCDNSCVRDNARVTGDIIELRDSVTVAGDAFLHGDIRAKSNARIDGNAEIGTPEVPCDKILIYGSVRIGDGACIHSMRDIFWVGPLLPYRDAPQFSMDNSASSDTETVFYRNKEGGISVVLNGWDVWPLDDFRKSNNVYELIANTAENILNPVARRRDTTTKLKKHRSRECLKNTS